MLIVLRNNDFEYGGVQLRSVAEEPRRECNIQKRGQNNFQRNMATAR